MKPFIVMEILEKAKNLEKQGHKIIHLEIGEPDFLPPVEVRNAVYNAVDNGKTHYTESFGISELREEISRYYERFYNISVSPERIFVTTGTSAGFILILSALFEKGEKVLILDPGYPCYKNFLNYLGLIPVKLDVFAEDNFKVNLSLLKKVLKNNDISGAIITSPSNPTGAMIDYETFLYLKEKVKWVISDEIYHQIFLKDNLNVFTGASFDRGVITIDGFSKKYSMTGFRLGWMVLPEKNLDVVKRKSTIFAQNLYICPPSISQYAGIYALKYGDSYIREKQEAYRERVKFLIPALKEIGISVPSHPEGAFYVYADVSGFTDDSFKFAFDVLEKAHVGITPGEDFGENSAKKYVRFSLANSLSNIKEGVENIKNYLNNL